MFLGIREALQLAAPSFPNEWLSWASALRRPAVGPCRHRCRPMPRGCSPPKEKIAIQAALVMETTLGSERFQIWFLEALRRFSTPSQWTSCDEDVLVDIARVANSRMDEVDMAVFDMIEESPEAVAATLASTWNEFPELLLVRELLADAELAPAWFRSMRNVK
jgi:hypothetical protein